MKEKYYFNTSASVKFDAAVEINKLSKISGASVSSIVQFMIKTFLENAKEEQVFNKLTEYQKKSRNYERLHYCPDEELINQIGRSRWFYRISISKMIYCCFLLFFDEVIDHFLGSDSRNSENRIVAEFIDRHVSVVWSLVSDVKYFLKRFNFIKEVIIPPPRNYEN